ncbi:MAG: COX15/CtaA family protein [Actinomycetota bacterium]|nr:COX15/CtaA family protein [Actinomycetota bacterium]
MKNVNERPISTNEKESLERGLRILTLTTLIATYLLIVLGSTVRVTESGMGCNGWPLCSGQIGPIDHLHPLLEQSHRYLATVVTILICAVAIVVWRAGQKAHFLKRLALAGVGVIVIQIVLGAITVFTNNAPVTVALHLIVGLLFLGIVTITTVRAFAGSKGSWRPIKSIDRMALWAVTGIFFVLISGSLVVDGGAEGACPSWPVCVGSHAQGGLIDLQLVHRAMVLLGTIVAVIFLVRVIRLKTVPNSQYRLAMTSLVLLAVQIAAGAVVAITKAPDALADVHLALGAALWSVIVATASLGAIKLKATQVDNVQGGHE